jgi:hypothetical protein
MGRAGMKGAGKHLYIAEISWLLASLRQTNFRHIPKICPKVSLSLDGWMNMMVAQLS